MSILSRDPNLFRNHQTPTGSRRFLKRILKRMGESAPRISTDECKGRRFPQNLAWPSHRPFTLWGVFFLGGSVSLEGPLRAGGAKRRCILALEACSTLKLLLKKGESLQTTHKWGMTPNCSKSTGNACKPLSQTVNDSKKMGIPPNHRGITANQSRKRRITLICSKNGGMSPNNPKRGNHSKLL